jgi:hypothetical protein
MASTCFYGGMLLGLFDPDDGGDVTPKRRWLSTLHGVISQKIVLFVTTAVRTSNPINVRNVSRIYLYVKNLCTKCIRIH